MKSLFNEGSFDHYLSDHICPICKEQVQKSNYLHQCFADQPLVEYIANLITHYRHSHITSWNKCWERGGSRYRSKWFGDYEKEKEKVNERAKRQLIRKCYPIFTSLGIKPDHFKKLKNTTDETMRIAFRFLK